MKILTVKTAKVNYIYWELKMPYGHMDIAELARFLGLDQRRLMKMAQRDEIPCRKIQGQLRFNRAEITEWLQQTMGNLPHTHLTNMDAGITAHRQSEPGEALIAPMLHPNTISTCLAARTKNSVLRELCALAQESEHLYDPEELLETLIQREELCSTAMEAGIAIPHPRRPLPCHCRTDFGDCQHPSGHRLRSTGRSSDRPVLYDLLQRRQASPSCPGAVMSNAQRY